MSSELSIQERWFADAICFGCGPANPDGLRIRSIPSPDGDGVVANWLPQPHHAAGPGVLNGGIVGALLDCHSVAAVYLKARGEGDADGTWATAEYTVRLRRPTPPEAPLQLFARVIEMDATEHAPRPASNRRGGCEPPAPPPSGGSRGRLLELCPDPPGGEKPYGREVSAFARFRGRSAVSVRTVSVCV